MIKKMKLKIFLIIFFLLTSNPRTITMDEALKKIYTNNLSANTDFLNDLSTLTNNYIDIQKSLQKVYKQQTSFALGE